MIQFNFVKNAALRFDSVFVSDHGRSPLSIAYDRLEHRVRTQGGGMRIYHRADKKTISASWENLPATDSYTVDKGMGAQELQTFYENNTGTFPVTITYDTGVTETLTMAFTEFSMELVRRLGAYARYNVSLSLEEV